MLKIVSWNIRHGKGRDGIIDIHRIVDTLKEFNADIYTIQEVDERSSRSFKVDQPRFLGDCLHKSYYFTPISKVHSGRYGIVTLTNMHVMSKKEFKLTGSTQNHTFQCLTGMYKDKMISIANIHAPFAERYKHAYWRNFFKYIDPSTTILSGDFNMYTHERVICDLKESMYNINELATFEDGRIYDYTFSPYPIISQTCVESTYSDHNILITEIDC